DSGFSFTQGPRLRLTTPTQQGSGPVSTLVQPAQGGGPPNLFVTNSGSNDVWRLPGVGDRFFNDQNPTVIPRGPSVPVQILGGNFNGQPGIVTVNSVSNDISLITDFDGLSPRITRIPTGGTNPVAAIEFHTSNGFDNLIVANNGNDLITLLEGG